MLKVQLKRRNYTTRNNDNVVSQFSNVYFAVVLLSDSVQRAFSFLHDKLEILHDRYFPLQPISKKYKNWNLWLSDTIRDAIKSKINSIGKV